MVLEDDESSISSIFSEGSEDEHEHEEENVANQDDDSDSGTSFEREYRKMKRMELELEIQRESLRRRLDNSPTDTAIDCGVGSFLNKVCEMIFPGTFSVIVASVAKLRDDDGGGRRAGRRQ
jgi:hypothetical protein